MRLWLTTLAFLSTVALAQDRPFQKGLLDQPNRPTMIQVENAIQWDGDWDNLEERRSLKNLRSPNGARTIDSWLQLATKNFPVLLAQLEKHFPNGRYAFIGRDVAIMADLFESYYLSLGQTDRVVRIGFSKPSILGKKPTDIFAYLNSKGITLESLSSRPLVLIDTVSTGQGRQGRAILNSVYREWKKKGGNPIGLLRKVQMVGLIVSTYSGKENPIQDFGRTVENMKRKWKQKLPSQFNRSIPPFTFKDQGHSFNEIGYEHWTHAWHGRFGPIHRNDSGFTITLPGSPNLLDQRRSVLLFQKRILDWVKSKEVKRAITREFKFLGISKPANAPIRSCRFIFLSKGA